MIASDVINDAEVVDNPSSPAFGGSSSVPCSICFDLVIDDGGRSTAKLHCGHEFHLDCIGSAFNTKGTMQCPNCRKVERGRWLFANGSAHAVSEIGAQDSMPNEGPHELSYSGRPFGFHWCPFSGSAVHSSFEEVDSSLNTFTNYHGNHAMITEHTAAPSLTRSYISYFRPSSSNFYHPWNAQSVPRNNLHYTNIQQQSQGWDCHFPPYSVSQSYFHRNDLAQADTIARSPSFLQSLHYTQRHVSRTGESSVANRHTTYHHEQPSNIMNMPSYTNHGFRRFNIARGFPMVLPAVSGQPDHRGGFYIREPEGSTSSYSSNWTHRS